LILIHLADSASQNSIAMTDSNNNGDNEAARLSRSDSESDGDSIPKPSREKEAAFIGYCAFPPVMNLYVNYSGVFTALTSHKLCGATETNVLYLAELHYGYTSRGPLNFGQGYYLRNGPSSKDPILAATGSRHSVPLLVILFDPKTDVFLPPLDIEKNPRDLVTETLRSTASKEHGVAFRFCVEVGVKRRKREEFEWRKEAGKQEANNGGHGDAKGTRYTLIRLAPSGSPAVAASSAAASSSSSPQCTSGDGGCEVVAELLFRNLWSVKHIFSLELLGAGRTGELGERWNLMVVMTTLSIQFMRQVGKTKQATIGVAQKLHSK
jgi:hypothetical protein